MTTKRYVVDSNVLISAALAPTGTSRAALQRVFDTGRLLFSEETFIELATRLMRPKFDRWVSREARLAYLDELAEFADWIEIEGIALGCRDPDDDKFIETAIIGRADGIVSGDRDLLALNPFGDIPIFAPGDWPPALA